MSKKIVLTDEQVEQVYKLASVLNQEQISDYLEISHDTFKAICDRDDRLLRAYKKGRAVVANKIGNSLISKALGGDTTCQIFYMKTQVGWREAKEAPEDQTLNVNIRDWSVKVKK